MPNLVSQWLGACRGDVETELYEEMRVFIENADERSARQLAGDVKWLRDGCRGTLEWCTGMGKTRAAVRIIRLLRREEPQRSVIIVVPSKYLKQQWEKGLSDEGLVDNTQVIVINTAIKTKRTCDLLICDEIHRMAAKSFAKIFDCITCDFTLGLTATLSRLDGRHSILVKRSPICDRISAAIARARGYIANYREYNCGIHMTEEEAVRYRDWKGQYQKMIDKFGQDFYLMKACTGHAPFWDGARMEWNPPKAVLLARSYGWRGNTPGQAHAIMVSNETAERGEKQSVWGGNLGHPYHPDKVVGYANNGMRLQGLMREFIYNHVGKTRAVIELCERFPTMKTIVFSERTAVAVAVADAINENNDLGYMRALKYYSKMPPQTLPTGQVMNEKAYKEILLSMLTDYTPYVLCTSRALDQGADIPFLQLGITHSRSSSKTQHTQRLGRPTRREFINGVLKYAIFVNFYVIDTDDLLYVTRGQKGAVGINWVNTIDEILVAEAAHVTQQLEI